VIFGITVDPLWHPARGARHVGGLAQAAHGRPRPRLKRCAGL